MKNTDFKQTESQASYRISNKETVSDKVTILSEILSGNMEKWVGKIILASVVGAMENEFFFIRHWKVSP